MPVRGINIILDNKGKRSFLFFNKIFTRGFKKIIKIIIDINEDTKIILKPLVIICLGENSFDIDDSDTILLIQLFIFKVLIFKNKNIVGKDKMYKLIPSVPKYLVIIILFSKPSILIMKPLIIIIDVLIKKEFLFFNKFIIKFTLL
jgi:hypothetical protein